MDINELKQLMKKEVTVVVVDEGKPAFVVLDYEYYKKMSGILQQSTREFNPSRSVHPHLGLSTQRDQDKNQELLEKLNKEILALKSQIADDEVNKQDINID